MPVRPLLPRTGSGATGGQGLHPIGVAVLLGFFLVLLGWTLMHAGATLYDLYDDIRHKRWRERMQRGQRTEE